MLELIYITPTIIAFLLRLFWWIYLSKPEDSFLPATNDSGIQPTMLMLAVWPFILFVIVGLAICVIVAWPFYVAANRLRARRIISEASIQNVSGVICERQQNRGPVLVSRVQVSKLDTMATRDSSRVVDGS